jgi:4-amino-4-deoxy-L-arabinose transferase-like glycosyltransferase
MRIPVHTFKVIVPFILIYAVFLTGHFIDIMDVDAAHYAAISVEMMHSDNWLEVYMRGGDYLDKPPLLFWISALSFKLFGVSNFTYRLFPVLLSFLGIFATYKLSRLFYSSTISYYAAVLFATSQAVFLMNHDVRTDNLLTTFIVVAVWQILLFSQNQKSRHAFLGCAAIGLAMLAKGPIGLIAPIGIVGIHLLLTRQWGMIFKWQWLIGLIIIALILWPMNTGLYQQFDIHPDKLVNGQTNVSGLKFFYWTQSFGRITGESTWNNNPGPFFQLNSYLWSFLPWTLFGLLAYAQRMRALIRSKFLVNKNTEVFTIGGVTFIFVSMSLSSYQLPHYTYPAYPFLAIFTASWLHNMLNDQAEKWRHYVLRIQYGVTILLALLCLVSMVLLLTFTTTLNSIVLIILMAVIGLYFWKYSSLPRVLSITVGVILSINLMLNLQFYPYITRFQSGSQAGKYVANLTTRPNKVYTFLTGPMSFDFYSGFCTRGIVAATDLFEFEQGEYWVFTSAAGLLELEQLGLNVTVQMDFEDYPITGLSPDFFLDKNVRNSLPRNYVLKLVIANSKL